MAKHLAPQKALFENAEVFLFLAIVIAGAMLGVLL